MMLVLATEIPPKLTKEHDAAVDKNSKAKELLHRCKVEKAEALLRDALDWSQKSLGSYHQTTIYFQEDLADLLARVGKLDEAIRINMAAWQAREKTQDSSRGRHRTRVKLASNLKLKGRLQEAVWHLECVHSSQLRDTATFGPDDRQTLRTGHHLATYWLLLGDQNNDNHLRAKAKDLHEDVLERQLRGKGIDDLDIVRTRGALGAIYYWANEYSRAKEHFSAGFLSLKSLKSAAVEKRRYEIEKLLVYFDEMRISLKTAVDESIKNSLKSKSQPSNPQPAYVGRADEPSRNAPAGHSRSISISQTPQIRVDEATTSAIGSGTNTRRNSHNGVRFALPECDRPPRASAPDLLKPPNATPTKRRSNSSPPSSDMPSSQSKIDRKPQASPLRNSQSACDTRNHPSTEQTDKDVGHSDRRGRSPRQKPQEAGSRVSKSQNITKNSVKKEQQQQKPRPQSSCLEEFQNSTGQMYSYGLEPIRTGNANNTKTRDIPRPVSAPPQDNTTDSTGDQQTRSASRDSRSKIPEPPSSPTRPTTSSASETASQPWHDSLPERPRRLPLPAAAGAFFDSNRGGLSDESEKWFRDLAAKTHALLDPLQAAAFKRVKVAVLDTGIHMGQINLWDKDRVDIVRGKNPRIKKKRDFLDPDGSNNCMDLDGHGTHCVGVIRKVAPEADIYVARVVRDSQKGPDVTAVVKALNYASNTWEVDIISLSFGFDAWIDPIEEAIQNAVKKSILVMAATANYGTSRRMTFPAIMPDVISLHAADYTGSAAGTNPVVEYGKNLTILGVDVLSAWIPKSSAEDTSDDDRPSTESMTGTSVATPVAAGIAALVLEFTRQRDPSGDPETDRTLARLRENLRKRHGMENVFRAMGRPTGGGTYVNIVPWSLLCAYPHDHDKHLGRRLAANELARIVVGAFGSLEPYAVTKLLCID